MNIKAEIIKDSIGPKGQRVTTFVLTYPRFIHSEFMSHRAISKNSASSRAIPAKRMRKLVMSDPVIPKKFTRNKKGMSAEENISFFANLLARLVWRTSGIVAVFSNFILEKLEVHKQHANRILEPYLTHTIVATATDWDNFFALRIDERAQPEMKSLAVKIAIEYISKRKNAQVLNEGEWHLPFVDSKEGTEVNLKRSVARCARVSYLNHDKSVPSLGDDIRLYNGLLASQPIHASPAEHQAMATNDKNIASGNFKGWVQYRKQLSKETVEDIGLFWSSNKEE